jgi:predicted RNase H-like nuclease (RuvC/YqgF family)
MEAKIAVATVSGKAYYLLVKALKERKIDFLSLTPFENVPFNVKVVITTEAERKHIKHPSTVVYRENTDPSAIVDEAIKLIDGKKTFDTLVVGLDPGKTFGLAVIFDGKVAKTYTCSSEDEAVKTVVRVFSEEQEPGVRVLKVGSSPPASSSNLLSLFDDMLPKDVAIEVVQEAGTTHFSGQTVHKRRLKHVMAAIKIAERHGQIYKRKGVLEQ